MATFVHEEFQHVRKLSIISYDGSHMV